MEQLKNVPQSLTLEAIASDENVTVGYSDGDIVIIDSVKMLADANVARVNTHLVALALEGRAQALVQGRRIEIAKNQVVVLPPNAVLGNLMLSPDFEFKALLISSHMLQSFLREKMALWNEMMYVRHLHVLNIEGSDFDFFYHFYEMLLMCVNNNGNAPYKTEIIQSLLRSGFLALCSKMQTVSGYEPAPPHPTVNALFQRFLSLLGNTEIKHRTVDWYASELCVSAKYLSSVCKKNSGKTANEWITEQVMEDIRYYLKNTDLSLKQVCHQLGFPNTSFFGKYVREHFGKTPLQLRKS